MFDPSGGLRYHWTALQRRDSEWVPHRQAVRSFLAEWGPVTSRLVLVGPSAGYSLPHGFLTQFERVLVIEPDPLARALLRRRFSGISFEWIKRARDLIPRLDRHHSVLFTNLLGQLSLSPAMEAPEHRGEFMRFLERVELLCPWASFHDRLSIDHESVSAPDVLKKLSRPLEIRAASRLSAEALAARFFKDVSVAYEHDADEWFPAVASGQSYRYWMWNLRPDQRHVIEATFSKRQNK